MGQRAEAYVPIGRNGWWGGPDTRIRCKQDDKVIFVDKEAAERSVAKSEGRMKCYLGSCGHWHLARKKKGRK